MCIHLERDLDSLQQQILAMCTKSAELVHQGVASLKKPNVDFCRELAEEDDEVDASDVLIEDACLKLLALHQPVARDLRRIATVLKIGGELERVADLGVSIAQRAAALASLPSLAIPAKLDLMANKALDMLDRSIAAYVALDVQAAIAICAEDDEVDALNREIIEELTTIMHQHPDLIEPAMHLFSASRNVERVADHATNIAENVVYLVQGDIVRHQAALIRHQRVSA